MRIADIHQHRRSLVQLLVSFFDINTFKLIHESLFLLYAGFICRWLFYRSVYVAGVSKRHNVICITLKCFFDVTTSSFFCYYAR
ncbi:hypothetical protein CKO_04843 [Citrobacter koseri ATCC BAA-895]|uniref:Uncharacterized protein n=1 Tax=Citrobacter koseri (strain ATCC BAA-895 / CDC 4225-83 / SGSC4696) TaxID=290338 RepID=A8AQX6_CITK8|nr:hypothetical protein CKO_04843 [Citrobacter koseri ATCC BAA-895]